MDNEPMNLDSAIAMTADEQPVLADAPETMHHLPGGGFLDDNGVQHSNVTVRELTGADEEALDAVIKSKANPYAQVEKVITRNVESIGGVTDITENVARRLLIGDRDFIIMAVRRATYGDIVSGNVVCQICGVSSDVTVNLADEKDVPIKRLEDSSKRTFTVPLRRGTAEVRLATGDDQWVLGENLNRTLAEMNTVMLSRCVLSINGQSTYESALEPLDIALRMGAADRQTILNFLADNQPGPKLREVKVPCSNCGVAIDAPLDMAGLLRG